MESFSTILLSLFSLSLFSVKTTWAQTNFYLSPTGNDSNDGTSPSSPFLTPQRAQQAVIQFKSAYNGVLPNNVNIFLASGIYSLASTLNITSADSGNGPYTVNWIGTNTGVYPAPFNPSTSTALSAGTIVKGWTMVNSSTGVYTATVQTNLKMIRQLFTSTGERRLLAQTPVMIALSTNQSGVIAAPGQLVSPMDAYTYASVLMYHNWVSSTNQISSIDLTTGIIRLVGQGGDPFFNAGGNRYCLQNVMDYTLLQPGTFWYNPSTSTLTYRALPGEDPTVPSNTTLVIEGLPVAVTLSGTSSNPVTNVNFYNLSIMHTAAYLEETCLSGGCSDQSGSDLEYASLMIRDATNVQIYGIEVSLVGEYGVWIMDGCSFVTVAYNWIHNLGAGGVRVGLANSGPATNYSTVSFNITVTDTVIEDAGYVIEAGAGVLLQQAHDCQVVHNHIHNLKYTGISTGWTWGYQFTSNTNLLIGWNLIHDLSHGILSDMGCIYNLGYSVGTQIINNVCHDVRTYIGGYGGWGLYTDEGSSYVTLKDNIVFHTSSAPFHQHYGTNNTVTNNVFAFVADPVDCFGGGCDYSGVRSSQHGPGGGEGVNSSFAFLRNIILLDNLNSTLFYSTVDYGFNNMTFDYNVYWSTALSSPVTQLTFPPTQKPTTFPEWQNQSKDGHSIISDPLFVDAEGLDFSHLEPTSPALALGFVPIDTSTVGPRPFV